MSVALRQTGTCFAQSVAKLYAAFNPVQQHVHEREAVRVLHQLYAVEGAGSVLFLLGLGSLCRRVVITQIVVGGDKKASRPRCWVLNDVI